MAMLLVMENVEVLNAVVWRVPVAPTELRAMGTCQMKIGTRSVILAECPKYLPNVNRLELDPSRSHLNNIGDTSDAIIVDVASVEERKAQNRTCARESVLRHPGDVAFLSLCADLPDPLRGIAVQLVERVPRHAPHGYLSREGLRYVERPDNFWTIEPHYKRVRSFTITLRGEPKHFEPSRHHIEVKRDRPGYSRFKLTDPSDLDEALRLILTAKRRPV